VGIITGWINVTLVFCMVLPFLLMKANKAKNKRINKAVRFLFKLHPFIFILFVISAVNHFIINSGVFNINTGTIAFLMLCFSALGGMSIKLFKLKGKLKFHQAFAFLSIVAVLMHIIL
jgi:branched-subunit amino acid transport protein AzlD